MSVYVGIDVHRKRSQVAVIDQDGKVLANRNVTNGIEADPVGNRRPASRHQGRVRGRVRLGMAGRSCWRTTASSRTWCTRCNARPSPLRG